MLLRRRGMSAAGCRCPHQGGDLHHVPGAHTNLGTLFHRLAGLERCCFKYAARLVAQLGLYASIQNSSGRISPARKRGARTCGTARARSRARGRTSTNSTGPGIERQKSIDVRARLLIDLRAVKRLKLHKIRIASHAVAGCKPRAVRRRSHKIHSLKHPSRGRALTGVQWCH